MKKYRLLKDLPDSKAGDIYELISAYGGDTAYYLGGDPDLSYWRPINVENNPEWFEEVKEEYIDDAFELSLDAKIFITSNVPSGCTVFYHDKKLYTEEDMTDFGQMIVNKYNLLPISSICFVNLGDLLKEYNKNK